jgi:DNA repair protein RecO (recombination protein O)
MLRLSAYLGFEPKQNYSAENNIFLLADGAFASNVLFEPTACSESTSEALNKLLQAGFDNLHEVKLSGMQRQALFNELMRYYELHEIGLGNLHSYKVLKQVYS